MRTTVDELKKTTIGRKALARLDAELASKKQLKYRNQPTGHYASKKEATRGAELRLLQRAGAISELQEQVAFEFEIPGKGVLQYASGRPVRYVADFVYLQDGDRVVEDVKSEATSRDKVYRIKKALMAYFHRVEIKET